MQNSVPLLHLQLPAELYAIPILYHREWRDVLQQINCKDLRDILFCIPWHETEKNALNPFIGLKLKKNEHIYAFGKDCSNLPQRQFSALISKRKKINLQHVFL